MSAETRVTEGPEGLQKKEKEKIKMYVVKRLNLLTCEWSYFNTYNNYKAAAEARDELTRRYGGMFKIFEA